MPTLSRVRRAIGKRWYARTPTEKLIALVANQRRGKRADLLIDALKERRAHQDGSLDHVDWSSAMLDGALLSSCRLKNACFARAHLRGAYFGYSDASSADFTACDLRDANLREARLCNAAFDGADLRSANFARALLQGSSFVGADLADANLWGADLRGANLSQASIKNCTVVDIKTDAATILPDGERCSTEICLRRFTRA